MPVLYYESPSDSERSSPNSDFAKRFATQTSGAITIAASIFRYFATLAPELEADDVRPFPNGQGESLVRKDPIGVLCIDCAVELPDQPDGHQTGTCPVSRVHGRDKTRLPHPVVVPHPRRCSHRSRGSCWGGQLRHRARSHGRSDGPPSKGRLHRLHSGRPPHRRRCGELLRPVTLELGGKSSAIVIEDADLDDMSAKLIRSCMRNTGQTCYISTRILAPASRYDENVNMVTDTVATAPQGDPRDPATVFRPSANHSQDNSGLAHLDSAKVEGARVTTGGEPAQLDGELADGLFIQPTVLADVTPDMRVAREENLRSGHHEYDDLDDAISLTNNTEFGLGGIVFGSNQDKALEVAEAMNTGSVGLNFFASNHAAPFGGRNDSGLGVEYGPEGLAAYLTYKSIHRR